MTTRLDLYVSADIEADGPVPGPYSMLSLGLCVAGVYDGTRFERRDPTGRTFYRELRPISDEWQPDALAVSGLDRDRLVREGADPVDAMTEAARWVGEAADGCRPVLVGYPVVFDWMFLHWYWVRFTGGSPFGHSSCLDIKTLLQHHLGVVLDRVRKDAVPEELRPAAAHTHNALDDAVEQAELFANLLEAPHGR